MSGEQIVYHYDQLNRLMDAETTQGAGTRWGQTFTYDGFGNLPTKGSYNNLPATTMNLTVNPANNQMTVSGDSYGVNGDLYDINNQLLSWHQANRTGSLNGGYDVKNRVMLPWASSGPKGGSVVVSGANGERLGIYSVSFYTDGTNWY